MLINFAKLLNKELPCVELDGTLNESLSSQNLSLNYGFENCSFKTPFSHEDSINHITVIQKNSSYRKSAKSVNDSEKQFVDDSEKESLEDKSTNISVNGLAETSDNTSEKMSVNGLKNKSFSISDMPVLHYENNNVIDFMNEDGNNCTECFDAIVDEQGLIRIQKLVDADTYLEDRNINFNQENDSKIFETFSEVDAEKEQVNCNEPNSSDPTWQSSDGTSSDTYEESEPLKCSSAAKSKKKTLVEANAKPGMKIAKKASRVIISDQFSDNECEPTDDDTNRKDSAISTRSHKKYKNKRTGKLDLEACVKIDESGQIKVADFNRNTPGTPAVDMKSKYVSRSKVTTTREPKLHVCIFCHAKIADKIKRHLITVHKDERIIKDIVKLDEEVLPNAILLLTNLGDYNAIVSNGSEEQELYGARRLNKKQIFRGQFDPNTGDYRFPDKCNISKATIVVKHTADGPIPMLHNFHLPAQESGDTHVPCRTCFKQLKISYLRKHKCPFGEKIKNAKGILQESINLIPDIHPAASERLRTLVIKTMQPGEIKNLVKQDKFIILYGNDLIDYYNKDQNYAMIRHTLRLLAYVVQTIKTLDINIQGLKDVLKRNNATLICDAIKIMAEHDEREGLVKKVNIVSDVTILLNKVLKFFKGYYKENDQDKLANELVALQDILPNKFKNLNKKARDTAVERAKDTPIQKLPKIEDIRQLQRYAENKRKKAFEVLCQERNVDELKNLNESTLLLLQLFNRKRQGEISRLLLTDLKESKMFRLDDACAGDEFTKLSEKSKKVAAEYVRIALINKKGLRTVGLLIHQRLLDSINLILTHRSESLKHNKYVFAREAYNKELDHSYEAYQIMRKYAKDSGVKDHTLLRGTILRKQLATMMYAVDLQDDNLKDLAHFLGHELQIHTKFYRQSIPVRELITITPLLEQAQGVDADAADNQHSEVSQNENSQTDDTLNESTNESDGSIYTENCPDSTCTLEEERMKATFHYKNKLEELESRKKKLKKVAKQNKNVSDDENNGFGKVRQVKKTSWGSKERDAVSSYVQQYPIPEKVSSEYLEGMKAMYPSLQTRTNLVLRAYLHNNGFTNKNKE